MAPELGLLFVGALASSGAWPANAAEPSKSEASAAIMVKTIDYYSALCERDGGFSLGDRPVYTTWQQTSGSDVARATLRELESRPDLKKQLDLSLELFKGMVTKQNVDNCRAALIFLKMPAAQFATAYPEMFVNRPRTPAAAMQAASPPAGSSTAPATTGATNRNAAPVAVNRNQAAILAQLESFAFDTRPSMGIGGFIGIDVYPVALFRDGRALTDVEGLNFPAGLAAHQSAHADDWTRWRRSSGKIELLKDGKWDSLEFQATYARLPDNFRLDGLFRSTKGVGNIAVGGTDSVVAWNEYRFSPDGRVLRGGGAGSFATGGDFSTATSAASADRRGRYRVAGLQLNITYDDGSRESRILITDPTDATRVLWLDGVGYVRRK